MPKSSSSEVTTGHQAPPFSVYVDSSSVEKPGTRNPGGDGEGERAGQKKKGLSLRLRPAPGDVVVSAHQQGLNHQLQSETAVPVLSGIGTQQSVPFTIYCDDVTETEGGSDPLEGSLSSSSGSSALVELGRFSHSTSSDSNVSIMETSGDGTGSEVMSVLSHVPQNGGTRKPLGEIQIDPWMPPSMDEMVEDESEDDDEYKSAASSSQDYHTAIQPSEKELHADKIYSCPVYFKDIYLYLKERESLRGLRPKRNYMRKQSELNGLMRCILVDWLVDVALEYDLVEETLHLAVSLVDRFLSVFDVHKEKLQLVGTTAMMIAAKFEEIYPPDLGEFVYITDDTYNKKQVLSMERLILRTLDFQVAAPNALTFAFEYLKICHGDARAKAMTMYLCDLSLLDLDIMKWLPSEIGAAAVCLANLVTHAEPWPSVLESWTGKTVKDIFGCLGDLLALLHQSSQLQQHSVVDKYKDNAKYCGVALLEHPELPEIQE